MKQIYKTLLIAFLAIGSIAAQQNIETNVRYNSANCAYDVYLRPTENYAQFLMGGSQITVILPQGVATTGTFNIISTNEPQGTNWNDNNIGSFNRGGTDYDAISVDNNGGSINGGAPINSGTEILLFSFTLPSTCIQGVRLWEVGDPENIGVSDFKTNISNALTADELWLRNWNNFGVGLPSPTPVPSFSCGDNTIDLFANPPATYPTCLGALTYNWTGPLSFTSTQENPSFALAEDDSQSGNYFVTVTDANGCTDASSVMVASNSCRTVPVVLNTFVVQKRNESSYLHWTTSSEVNNLKFEIEHSTDQKNFTKIGQIAGVGNTSELQSYDFTHRNPAEGLNFYRLKQMDYNGQFEYSDIKTIEFERENTIDVYPNPASDYVTINTRNFDSQGKLHYQLFNTRGQIAKSGIIDADSKIDLSDANNGVFCLRILDDQKTILHTKKLYVLR